MCRSALQARSSRADQLRERLAQRERSLPDPTSALPRRPKTRGDQPASRAICVRSARRGPRVHRKRAVAEQEREDNDRARAAGAQLLFERRAPLLAGCRAAGSIVRARRREGDSGRRCGPRSSRRTRPARARARAAARPGRVPRSRGRARCVSSDPRCRLGRRSTCWKSSAPRDVAASSSLELATHPAQGAAIRAAGRRAPWHGAHSANGGADVARSFQPNAAPRARRAERSLVRARERLRPVRRRSSAERAPRPALQGGRPGRARLRESSADRSRPPRSRRRIPSPAAVWLQRRRPRPRGSPSRARARGTAPTRLDTFQASSIRSVLARVRSPASVRCAASVTSAAVTAGE